MCEPKAAPAPARGSPHSTFVCRADISEAELVAEIERLNQDDRIDGVLVQLPLPRQIDPHRIVGTIDPAKDVDGFHPVNVGRLWSGLPTMVPCTPQGCLRLLRTVHRDLAGLDAVVLGRSNIVGKPLAALLIGADCTVTVIHSKTRDAREISRRADILIAAAGQPGMVNGRLGEAGGHGHRCRHQPRGGCRRTQPGCRRRRFCRQSARLPGRLLRCPAGWVR